MGVEQAVILLSEFLGIHERTVWKWRARGLDVEDPAAVAKFLRAIQRPSPSVAKRIAEGELEERLVEILQANGLSRRNLKAQGDGLTLKDQKTLKEVELLDLKIQQQRGELVSRSAMREVGQRVGALIVAELAAMANDAPGQLAGADEATIRERLEARHVVLVNRLRAGIAEIETVGMEE